MGDDAQLGLQIAVGNDRSRGRQSLRFPQNNLLQFDR